MSKWLGKKRQEAAELLGGKEKSGATAWEPAYDDLIAQSDCTKNIFKNVNDVVPNYLHPNPAERVKGVFIKKGGERQYKHAVGEISSTLTKGGEELTQLNPDSLFGAALSELGDAFGQVLEFQHTFDTDVNQNYLSAVKTVLEQDAKDIARLSKKLHSRRLDYDFKHNKNEKASKEGKPEPVPQVDVDNAHEKMMQTKDDLGAKMTTLVHDEASHIKQLESFVGAHIKLMEDSLAVMHLVREKLAMKADEAASQDRESYQPESPTRRAGPASAAAGGDFSDDEGDDTKPHAIALYDFDAENEGELSFKDGWRLNLLAKIDENWFEGEVNGAVGIFPANYVKVVVEP